MKVSILGAGMAGCGAAHRLGEMGVGSVVYDKNDYVGGHAASWQVGGFTLDEGPHISFTKNERVKNIFAENVGGEFVEGKVVANNHWRGYWIKHPAQVNLHGLPSDLVVRCLRDFIDAPNTPNLQAANYEEWLVGVFGRTFAETFPMEYTKKYHTTPANNMSVDWMGPRIYRPNLDEVLAGAVSAQTDDVQYNADFRYPKKGGFGAYLGDGKWLPKTEFKLSHKLKGVDAREKILRFVGGEVEKYERLVSSVPLTDLLPMIDSAPARVLEAAAKLSCSEVVLVSVGVDREDIMHGAHWTYFYDDDYLITRLTAMHLLAPGNAPPGCGCFQAECYYSPKYLPFKGKAGDCVEPVISDLRRCGLLKDSDKIMFTDAVHVPYANIVFDLERKDALAEVHAFLDETGIFYCGRYGDWGYMWTDQSFISGERAAEKALK